MNFTNKVVIITGASSGIGAGAAEYLSTLGANLVLTGRNAEKLKSTVEKCMGKGKVLSVIADVNLEVDRERIVNETIEKFGKVDVLVNNAGIAASVTGVLDTKMEEYDNIFTTNVRSVFHLTQLVAPHLIKTKGNIVNVSSIVGLHASPTFTAYFMSKGALDQFTKCTALELAPHGVRVNSINPGVIVTDFFARMGMNERERQGFLARAGASHPLGRVGTVEETAHAIAFLACNNVSAFITGTLLPVDGGRAISCPR